MEGALFIPLLYHAGLWAVYCVMPVLHAGRGVLVECLMCSRVQVQSAGAGCCAVVVTSSPPVKSVGHWRATVLLHCDQCVHWEGMPVDM